MALKIFAFDGAILTNIMNKNKKIRKDVGGNSLDRSIEFPCHTFLSSCLYFPQGSTALLIPQSNRKVTPVPITASDIPGSDPSDFLNRAKSRC